MNKLALYIFYFIKNILSHSKELPQSDEAENLLNSFRKDPKSSCFRKLETPEKPGTYDLDIIVPCYNVEKYVQ